MTSDTLAARGAVLTEALADLRNAVDGGQPWHPRDFETFTPKRAQTVATILNAVIDGSLVSTVLAASPEGMVLIADGMERAAACIMAVCPTGMDAADMIEICVALTELIRAEAAALKGAKP